MDDGLDIPHSGPSNLVGSNGTAYRPRGYQLEMLQASLQQNIIVAMDTGSGKTHIAVLRIIAELEICAPEKLVWFLAPTVALCLQQHEVIASQIPSIRTRVLTGADNVDRWTKPAVWNSVLEGVRVVCSTYAVLSDALNHGFVRMARLALLIFDEAHHCTGGHPARKIMQYHYHPTRLKSGSDAIPRVLGLTASPIVRYKPQDLQAIEASLDAVCKTPRVHRSELLKHVHRPQLECIRYKQCTTEQPMLGTRLLYSLIHCAKAYDIHEDPYMEMLRYKLESQGSAELLSQTGKTFCSEQLAKLIERSRHMYEELGGWATDYFIQASIDQLRRSIEEDNSMTGLDRAERVYLLELLLGMPVPADNEAESFHISPKLEVLLAFLDKMDRPKFSGLIFVRRRVTVSVLARLLSLHPATKDRFRCAPYVGWSSNSSRKDYLGDLLTRDMQRDTLSEFKAGRRNLIIATDVLEEGLDVSSCSLVICYDKPSNLKSFVQRRGRARHQQSTYAIVMSTEDHSLDFYKWEQLERTMIEAYQNDERVRQKALELERIEENVDDWLIVPSTSARLSADDAMQHLHHFCAVLPVDESVDNRPSFSFEDNPRGLIRSTVTLPNSVHPAVRQTQGRRWWRTERAARKESAFQAYKALWKYGLVNDNLLPLTRKPDLQFTEDTQLPAVIECSEQYDPYMDLANIWVSPDPHQTNITVSHKGVVNQNFLMSMVLPQWTPMPDDMTFYWSKDETLKVSLTDPQRLMDFTTETLQTMREITSIYLQAPSSRVNGPEKDFVALFVPTAPPGTFEEWIQKYQGTDKALDIYAQDPTRPLVGIVRDTAKYSEPRLFREWVISRTDQKTHVEIECQSLPRRRNLLQDWNTATAGEDGEMATPKTHIVPAAGCTVDRLPSEIAIFGRFISAILDRFEATMVAHKLNDTILKGAKISKIEHVLTAITSPIAQATANYQLYEFFGDSVLKFTVSCQLFFLQPKWHEGYLSESRDKLIQNKRLARAALDTGLDSFILTNRFTPRKWNAPLVSKRVLMKPGKRQLSMKVLADVVEAVIGAAYMDGGMEKAQACLHRFLPEITLFTKNIPSFINPTDTPKLKLINEHCISKLIGYTFKQTSLLTEALTHPSCEFDTITQSYQRIEYLGDAVLDMVVVSVIAAYPHKISQGKMTLIKHAVVNANLLAFLCLEHSVLDTTTEMEKTSTGDLDLVTRSKEIQLWQFLRFNGPVIKASRDACVERYKVYRTEIQNALHSSQTYPWALFAILRADKFISDIVESTIGAIFVDSQGSLEACTAYAERIGLLPYLRRIISDGVDVKHPRNKAQDLMKAAGSLAFKARRVEVKGGAATYQCSAVINKEVVASVQGCTSAEEAEIKVSHILIEKARADKVAAEQTATHMVI
ncbi:hypothetical protein N7462_001230 [Penicillium macrosclerotiorum]|uniref:uncharacterized protein n=1 Tax=Penicillium macrosclerotiorum TaxID=303699 RepID=UPI0025492574|nr:uncharacterized protein N7462_001230 [Penicillium macrosclerotiorum]KAJ5691807.1 hypothetical protein N7462_001230 [Penicillium macrosclerotiorum]